MFFESCSSSENGSDPVPRPMSDSVSSQVKLSLTVFYITMYSALFISVYVQLWLILYYNYKRFSFQTVFLMLCALWSSLRATLFSFYFRENDTIIANRLAVEHWLWHWLLYCFPVCVQFFTLCLLNLYFAQVMFKAKPRYAANPNHYIIPLRTTCMLAVVLFLVMNISCAVIVDKFHSSNADLARAIVLARVVVNDGLDIIFAVSLAYYIYKISNTTSANILLEAKGTTVCQATTVSVMIILLYTSRAVYNLLAIGPLRCAKLSSFNFDWYNVSDQADLVDLSRNESYIVFGVVLFVWELLPTSLTVLFFRVKRPDSMSSLRRDTSKYNSCHNARVYFFDDPHHCAEREYQNAFRPKLSCSPFHRRSASKNCDMNGYDNRAARTSWKQPSPHSNRETPRDDVVPVPSNDPARSCSPNEVVSPPPLVQDGAETVASDHDACVNVAE